MVPSWPDDPHWPLEIARLHAAIQAAGEGAARDTLRGSLWRLLFEALMRFLRVHSRHSRGSERADLEDIAAEIALEILLRAESGAWAVSGRSAAEISGYVSSAASYGRIDHMRRGARTVQMPDGDAAESTLGERMAEAKMTADAPANRIESRELTSALRSCVEVLPERERRVWFYRAYYEMNSREIATHPLVQLKAPHVDVLIQRTREALRDCMRRKGHAVTDTPPTAFVDLWEMLEAMAGQEPDGRDEAARWRAL